MEKRERRGDERKVGTREKRGREGRVAERGNCIKEDNILSIKPRGFFFSSAVLLYGS